MMKTFSRSVAMLLGLGLLPVTTHAQKRIVIEDGEPNSVMFMSTDKARDEVIRIINKTRLPRFQEPKTPRFILTNRQGRFALDIGGYVRATAEYNFGGTVKDVDFYPALIPSRRSVDHACNQFQMDISTSTPFLRLVGHTKHLGDLVVYTAANFRGDGETFELQNAYAIFLGFTLGYSYGNFMGLATLPLIIDFAGPSGSAFYRTTRLSYMCDRLKNRKFGAGVEMSPVDGATNRYLAISTQRMPDFTASAQYNRNVNNHLKLAAIVHNMICPSSVDSKAHSKAGYGLQTSTFFNVAPKWQVYGQMNYERGIGQYLNSLSSLNMDVVPSPEKGGCMQTLPMLGWFAGLQYNISKDVFISSTYSLSRLYSEHTYPSDVPDMHRKGQYPVANLSRNVTNNLQVGAEYLRGWRTDFNSNTCHTNRMNALVRYSF